MRKRLIAIFAALSAMALVSVAALAQVPPPTPEPGPGVTPTPGVTPEPGAPVEADYAVVRLEEQAGSGFQGIAVMREGEQAGQTEVVVVVTGTNGGLLGLFGPDAESLGSVAIVTGTCEELGSVLEELGELQALQMTTQEEDAEIHVLATSVQMGLDEILTGQYVIAVLEREDDDAATPTEPFAPGTPTPATPTPAGQPGLGQQQQELNAMACGALTADARVQPELPMPGIPTEPIEPTPTPIEPTPAPAF